MLRLGINDADEEPIPSSSHLPPPKPPPPPPPNKSERIFKTCVICSIFAPESEQVCPKCGGEMSAIAQAPKTTPQAETVQAARKGSTSGAGIAAVVLGAASFFLPYFAAVFFVPAALVCSLVALKNKATGLGIVGLVLSAIGAIAIFGTSSSLSKGLTGTSSSTATSSAPSCLVVRNAAWSRYRAIEGEDKSSIEGELYNGCNATFSSVFVSFNVFDYARKQVQSTLDSTSNLGPGTTWRFKAPVTVLTSDTFKFSELTAIPR
jgi:hypothetical protein